MSKGTVFEMTNDSLRLKVDLSEKKAIKELSNKQGDICSNKDRELFLIKIYNKVYSNADFKLVDWESCKDKTEDMVSALYELAEEALKVKVSFINDRKYYIRVLYQVFDGYKYGVPYASFIKIPLLSEIEYEGEGDELLPPGCQFQSKSGKKVLMPLRDYQYSSDIRPPLVVLGSDKQHGFSITFPHYSDLNNAGCCQNQNKFITMLESEDQIRNDFILIAPDASFNDTVELMISGLSRGWPEAFNKYRTYWQSGYDFSEYDREDLKWFEDTAIHNFVFFFGKEGFDRKKKKIDVDGLLKQGEEFGGYDTVTIWNQYPRLGVDQRTQWEFHDDFPGGRAAIREAVDKFHEHGVRVLLPYIPWDQGPHECTESMGDEFAKLVKDTDADGYQLDTLYDLPFSFRKKCDEIKPGILLQSQFHPTKNHPMEFLTSSWDEFWRQEPMPESDVLRFIAPMHIAPQISRWLRYEDKSILIQRVIFGGAPMVIWQDVFGRWMPFSEDQKAEIKKWKTIYLANKDIFQGPKPIPLYTTYESGIWCNAFFDKDEKKSIYSFYNENEDSKDTYIDLWIKEDKAEELYGDSSPKIDGDKLNISLPGKKVALVKLTC